MFAKCIRQHFLISILPPDLLICTEGKTLTDQHIESVFYPHWSANQQISILPLPDFIRAADRAKYPNRCYSCLASQVWQICTIQIQAKRDLVHIHTKQRYAFSFFYINSVDLITLGTSLLLWYLRIYVICQPSKILVKPCTDHFNTNSY